MGLKITFHGAAETVTGSKTLLESGNNRILVDCGMFQGPSSLRKRNWDKPEFEPHNLSAIVLTHAHVDHTGHLPLMIKYGFKGPIYCTPATKALLELLLPDTAYLQEEQARHAKKHGYSKHKDPKPLFTQEDAEVALSQVEEIDVLSRSEIMSDVSVTPTKAGHILGSNSLLIEMDNRSVSFSGDIGRYDMVILPDPQPMALGDLVVCESTYGDRLHPESDPETELAEAVNLAVQRNGCLLIPSFAVGRTQTLLYFLAKLEREGKIASIPVRVDSPMALDATIIYRRFKYDFDEDAQKILEDGDPVLLTKEIKFCRTVAESKELNNLKGPHIIISASGMATGGRILHHLKRLLPRSETTVLLVGYQAYGTRGRSLQENAEFVKIHGQKIANNAHIKTISSLSAHGDRNELLKWLKSSDGNPHQIKINHGEPDTAKSFARTLEEEFSWTASMALDKETISL